MKKKALKSANEVGTGGAPGVVISLDEAAVGAVIVICVVVRSAL
jgi:hypothetical protein